MKFFKDIFIDLNNFLYPKSKITEPYCSDIEERTKEIVSAYLYQKVGEYFFDHEDAEGMLDCLAYMTGDYSFKDKAVNYCGGDFINECLAIT